MEITVAFQPGGEIVQVEAGTPLRDIVGALGLSLAMPCGGMGRCGKCKVTFQKGAPAPTTVELEVLSKFELAHGCRLACMTVLREDAVVSLSGLPKPANILTSGVGRTVSVDPAVTKRHASFPPPDSDDPRSDLRRIGDSLGVSAPCMNLGLSAIRDAGRIIRSEENEITGLFLEGNLIACEPGDTSRECYGVAFDLGTTTIAGYLIDLLTGEERAVAASLNPQVRYGDDIISRIAFADRSVENINILQSLTADSLNGLIRSMCSEAGIATARVYDVLVAGNTAMQHLFLGLDPHSLAQSPYVPMLSMGIGVDASELGLDVNQYGVAHVLPSIAGFVGGDTVGVLLSTDLYHEDGTVLAVDIGTNGEIVLASGERILACSTAAGPAFEGAHIKNGMRAHPGAIDSVWLQDDSIRWSTIDEEKAAGICGSGLLDAVVALVRVGIIDEGGRMLSADEVNPDSLLRDRLHRGPDGIEFIITLAEESATGEPIVITQRDVRELQLAKGAISAGIGTLMDRLSVEAADLSKILLAGAFGNYIRKESAIFAGIIPDIPLEKIESVGNAAGSGAKLALISVDARREADRLSELVEHVELMLDPGFQDRFADAMMFGGSRFSTEGD